MGIGVDVIDDGAPEGSLVLTGQGCVTVPEVCGHEDIPDLRQIPGSGILIRKLGQQGGTLLGVLLLINQFVNIELGEPSWRGSMMSLPKRSKQERTGSLD